MRSSVTVTLSAFAVAAALPAAAFVPPNARPDLNAFVNRKVSDTSSLLSQVKSDPEVADRYERHFGMNRQELVSYLGALHRGTLAQTGSYTVYSIPEGGRVKMHKETLKKGSPMFFDRSGKPTLIMKCGNPVVLGPARVRRGNPLTVVPMDTEKTRLVADLIPRDADVINPDDLLALTPAVPEVVPVTVPAEVTTTETTETAPAIATVPVAVAAGGHAFPYAALLPLGFLGFIHSGGGSGGGGGIAPVPEPTTMAAMALGVVAVVRRRRRS